MSTIDIILSVIVGVIVVACIVAFGGVFVAMCVEIVRNFRR